MVLTGSAGRRRRLVCSRSTKYRESNPIGIFLESSLWLFHPELMSLLDFHQGESGWQVRSLPGDKWRAAGKEEVLRQLAALYAVERLGYPFERVRLEFPVQVGSQTLRADIAICADDGRPLVLGEVKAYWSERAVDQLTSYMLVTGTPSGFVVSPENTRFVVLNLDRQVVEVKELPPFAGPRTTLHATPAHAEPLTNVAPSPRPDELAAEILAQARGIEKLVRVNDRKAILTVHGVEVPLPFGAFSSYRKLSSTLAARGIAWAKPMGKDDFHALRAHLFATATTESTSTHSLRYSSTDRVAQKVLAWLPSQDEYQPMAMREILESAGIRNTKAHQMRVGGVLRSAGLTPGPRVRCDGRRTRLWMWHDG